jgi:hypothetical protein
LDPDPEVGIKIGRVKCDSGPMGNSMTATDIDAQTRRLEIEAIERVDARVEDSQNSELPDEFVSLSRADVIWPTGRRQAPLRP